MDKELMINSIIEDCDKLKADETIVVQEFGSNKDLTLHIIKDCDYDRNKDRDENNMVFIATRQNGVPVDDSGDIHVLDLHRVLVRIWDYKDFKRC